MLGPSTPVIQDQWKAPGRGGDDGCRWKAPTRPLALLGSPPGAPLLEVPDNTRPLGTDMWAGLYRLRWTPGSEEHEPTGGPSTRPH